MSYADKDSLHIPYPSWAKDRDTDGGDLDFENWKELQRWADRLTFNNFLIIDVGDGAVPTGHTKAHWISQSGSLHRIVATLSVVGSTDTIANVLRDGAIVDTVTIPASTTVATFDVSVSFSAGQFWQMQQTSAGTGAGGLTYFGEFG